MIFVWVWHNIGKNKELKNKQKKRIEETEQRLREYEENKRLSVPPTVEFIELKQKFMLIQ